MFGGVGIAGGGGYEVGMEKGRKEGRKVVSNSAPQEKRLAGVSNVNGTGVKIPKVNP